MVKILVIRFSSIGDIVLTSPVIRCLKNQMPESELHYITKAQFLPVLEANPYIDRIHTIKDKVSEVLNELKEEHYDHVVDLHKNFRSKEICLKLGKGCTSFDKINFRKWLIVNFKYDRLPPVHIVDRYFGAVSHLGVTNDNGGLDYFIPPRYDCMPQELPAPFRERYIGWVIGGKHNTKVYPEEKVIGACSRIPQPVVLIGGPEDMEKGDRIGKTAGSHVFNACGKLNLSQSASVVKNAALVLTNDTGMMHVAAAFRKRIISFWGNTIPEFGMYPYMPGDGSKSRMLEVKDLSCRPCSKLGYRSCPRGHFRCMNDIGTEQVIKLIEEGLNS